MYDNDRLGSCHFQKSTIIIKSFKQVTVAKAQMVESQGEHRRRAAVFKEAEESIHCLEEKLKKEIKRSRIYFEAKERFENTLEEIKAR